ncbi:aspartyl-phosphate phosphatase Spo0E family protein [Tumebacillus permanentifrigoris]|uniref:Spo0E like sporulation regulatory protein n=1 Tax=Tumebacillus permanentifrigoris TaxID=378543 RepID=A0A316D8W1_9BACL|nr:aspartyl-phosphate phosphatase Spo0E family protein [Tumebacillus permanentifrigoris]PWK11250.1 Spo0E like sporulation regulatory protein [Tumebacillus permanentifrigoris]
MTCIMQTIELLRHQLNECARHHQGDLQDPEIIALSQALDVLLLAKTRAARH